MKAGLYSKFILYLIALACLALTGCSPAAQQGSQEQEIDLVLDVDPNPASVGPGHLAVTLTGDGGTMLEGAVVHVEGSMNHDGMQPLLAQLRSAGDGSYEAPFAWSMAGEWTMDVTATLPDGQEISQEFQIAVNDKDHEHDHHEDEESLHVPNEGATIRILEPADGAVFAAGSDIHVVVAFEQFDLAVEGNHWHITDNDMSSQMIMGGMDEATLRDLEPGQHELSVYMSNGNHEELEDGASVMITISE